MQLLARSRPRPRQTTIKRLPVLPIAGQALILAATVLVASVVGDVGSAVDAKLGISGRTHVHAILQTLTANNAPMSHVVVRFTHPTDHVHAI
jgi:hypothetical protein